MRAWSKAVSHPWSLIKLEREEMEATVFPWLWVMVLNTASLALYVRLLRWGFGATDTERQAIACFYGMWLLHSTPPCFAPWDPTTPSSSGAGTRHWSDPRTYFAARVTLALCLGAILVGLAGVVPVWVLLLAKVAAMCLRHWLWLGRQLLDSREQWYEWTVRFSSMSVCSYVLGLGMFGLARVMWLEGQTTGTTFFFTGVLYPMARHFLRLMIATLLGDPHGHTRALRIYTGIALDFPCFVFVYSQEDPDLLWSYSLALLAVDAWARLWVRYARLFSLSQILWLKLAAVGSISSVWPAQERRDNFHPHAMDLLDRFTLSVSYCICVGVLPPCLRHVYLWATCQLHSAPAGPEGANPLARLLDRVEGSIPLRERLGGCGVMDLESVAESMSPMAERRLTPDAILSRHLHPRLSAPPVRRRASKPTDYAYRSQPHAFMDLMGIAMQLDSIILGLMAVALSTTCRG